MFVHQEKVCFTYLLLHRNHSKIYRNKTILFYLYMVSVGQEFGRSTDCLVLAPQCLGSHLGRLNCLGIWIMWRLPHLHVWHWINGLGWDKWKAWLTRDGWLVYVPVSHVVWTSSQHGGLRVVRLHTWQFKPPSVSVPEKKERAAWPFMKCCISLHTWYLQNFGVEIRLKCCYKMLCLVQNNFL